MSGQGSHARDWEDLGQLDPLWAVASTDAYRHGAWDADAFLATGHRKARKVLARLDELGIPERHDRALDFGCGVGRLTLPLSERFGEVVGIDIAPAMLERARVVCADAGNVRFVHDDTTDLTAVPGGPFDLVYSGLVLQHLPSRALMRRALRALTQRVAPGGALVVGVPVWLAPRHRLQLGRRLYAGLRMSGVPPRVLYDRLGLHPMRMTTLPREVLERDIRAAGLEILRVDERERAGMRSAGVYATRR